MCLNKTNTMLTDHPTEHDRFLPGIPAFCCGIVSRLEFERIPESPRSAGRPKARLCSISLRSPRPCSFQTDTQLVRCRRCCGCPLVLHRRPRRGDRVPRLAAVGSHGLRGLPRRGRRCLRGDAHTHAPGTARPAYRRSARRLVELQRPGKLRHAQLFGWKNTHTWQSMAAESGAHGYSKTPPTR